MITNVLPPFYGSQCTLYVINVRWITQHQAYTRRRVHYLYKYMCCIWLHWDTRFSWLHHCRIHSCRLDDVAEDRTPPGPGAVGDDVGRVGDEWSVVCVELARVVTGTVVVRVTDRWQRTVEHALHTNIHLDSARHFVDHLLSCTIRPLPTCVNVIQSCICSNFCFWHMLRQDKYAKI